MLDEEDLTVTGRVKVLNDEEGVTTIETRYGNAYFTTDLPLSLKIGDQFTFPGTEWYVGAGIIIYSLHLDDLPLPLKIILNGQEIKFQ